MGNPEFLVKGAQFIATHPDFNEKMDDAARRGLDFAKEAGAEIERLARADVLYWLAEESNQEGASWLMNLKGQAAIDEVHRLATRLEVQGFERDMETDGYLSQRRQARRNGLSFEEQAAAQHLSKTDAYILSRKLEKRGNRGR